MNKKEFNDIFKKIESLTPKQKNKIIRELAGDYIDNLKYSFEKQLDCLEHDLESDINFYLRYAR